MLPYFRRRYNSFGYAFKGIKTLILTQPHAKIHLVATIGVLFLGFYFNISIIEWLAVLSAIFLVWISEALNTSIEFLTDLASPEYHEKAGKVKDMAAGAVLISSVYAFIIGLIVFIPYIRSLI